MKQSALRIIQLSTTSVFEQFITILNRLYRLCLTECIIVCEFGWEKISCEMCVLNCYKQMWYSFNPIERSIWTHPWFGPISFRLDHLKDMMTKISPEDTNDHQVNLHHLHARSEEQDLSWTRFEFLINENQFRNLTFYLYVKSYHTYSIFSLSLI